MSSTRQVGLTTVLPKTAPYADSAGGCLLPSTEAPELPEHLVPCRCPSHDGACTECGNHVTLSPGGELEYGHQRSQEGGGRETCSHRPDRGVDPYPRQDTEGSS